MNKKILAVAMAATLAPSLALAEDVTLNVIGTIVPTACVPSFTGGATVDLGGIGAATLNPTTQTELPASSTELVITCNEPAAVQVRVFDNALATAPEGVVPTGAHRTMTFGLGLIGDVKIGTYALRTGVPTADGVAVQLLEKTPWNGSPWYAYPDGRFLGAHNRAGRYASWGTDVASGPIAATVHTLPLSVRVAITKGEDLPLTDEIPMAGSATFVVSYL